MRLDIVYEKIKSFVIITDNAQKNLRKMNITTKTATLHDIDFINEVLRHSLSHWPYTNEQLDQFLKLFKVSEGYLSKEPIYLAYLDNLFLGFFCFSVNDKQEHELDYFIIAHDLIGRGYGKAMWCAFCAIARSRGVKELIIYSTPEAKGFYEKMGAQQIGEHPSAVRKDVMMPVFKFIL